MHRVRAFLLLLLVAPTTAFAQNGPPQVIPANQRDVSPPLRTIPPVARQGGTLEAEPHAIQDGGRLRPVHDVGMPLALAPVVRIAYIVAERLGQILPAS